MNQRFSRIVALLAIAAAFYIGHGLHHRDAETLPLINAAQAEGMVLHRNENKLFTVSPDGKIVYMWQFAGDKLRLVDSAQQEGQ